MSGHAESRTADRVVAVLDVGSVRNLGWWRTGPGGSTGGTDLALLVDLLVEDLEAGRPVALGLEAPLFIPMADTADRIGRQRVGEAGRPWCAGAGTTALAFGIQEAAFLARRIAARTTRSPRAGVDPAAFLDGALDLLVFEAFVSGGAKDRAATDPHVTDARAAAEEFVRRSAVGTVSSDIAEPAVLNLAAAALLAAGLADDVGLLSAPCVVVKAPVRDRSTGVARTMAAPVRER
ncbi:hypothetical protein [Nocardia thailandica]